jgi:hypothetical protein
VRYVVDNQTGLDVCEVYISPVEDTVWGPNLLGGDVIAPWNDYGFDVVAGYYDVQILDCFGGILYEEWNRPIGSDEGYRFTTLDYEVEFYIQNNFGFNLCWFYFKPDYSATWDEHNTAPVSPGARSWFTLTAGFYDINIHDCGGFWVDGATNVYIGPTTGGFTSP